jgi:hypothetical protein
MPKSGDRIWGTRTLRFHVVPANFQKTHSVGLYIRADEASGARTANNGDPVFSQSFACNQSSGSNAWTVPWDSENDTPYNGKYKVNVTAYFDGTPCGSVQEKSASAERANLLVDNPPDALAPAHIIATTPSTISIGWDASTAPDVTRYAVYRAKTSSATARPQYRDFDPVGYTSSRTFRDQQVLPGVYWYSIVVTRRSVVTTDSGISSGMSAMSQGTQIKAPTPAPTRASSGGKTFHRTIPLSRLALPPIASDSPAVPDAPYSAQLPYGDIPEQGSGSVNAAGQPDSSEQGASDPRGPVLPVAVGAFLTSAALALSRLPS